MDAHLPLLIAPTAASAEVREVIVTFKTHFDIGYTDLASNVVQRYRTTMIDQALKVVDQNRDLPPAQQFVWTIPGWPMSKILADWEGQTPQRKQQILQAFKDGRFVVHGLPFTMHTELLEPEDLVRGLGFAARLSRDAGLALPRDAKMTDVPCHSWILPTLLKHAGIDFLHLGCNSASSSPEVPALFWWEGPDGSRLLTMYSAGGYGTGLVPPKDWPYNTWLALQHTGDNHGPPTPDEVKKLLAEAAQKLPGVKVRIGRLSDFADAILAEKAEIPVVRGDMPDTWIHGPMCDPAGAKIARNIRPALGYAESLNTLLGLWGVTVPDATNAFAEAYEKSLLYGEHTWGGALYWVTTYGKQLKWGYGDVWKADRAAGRFAKLEASWAEHTAYIEKARDLVTPVLENEHAGVGPIDRSRRAARGRVQSAAVATRRRRAREARRREYLRVATGGRRSRRAGRLGRRRAWFRGPGHSGAGLPHLRPRSRPPRQPTNQLRSDAQTGSIENDLLKVTLDLGAAASAPCWTNAPGASWWTKAQRTSSASISTSGSTPIRSRPTRRRM